MRFLLPVAAFLSAAALAAEPTDVDINDAVPGYMNLSYGDLLTQVLPDLKRGDGGKSVFWVSDGIEIRDIEGEMDETGVVSLAHLQTLAVRHNGRNLLAVMAADNAANGWLAIVAVYDLAGAPKLVDAVNAGMDRVTGLSRSLTLSDRDTGLVVSGAHGNSNEYFDSVQVLMMREAKLASVFYAGTYSLQVCGMEMKQNGTLAAEPDPGKPYAALIYTITQEVKRPAEDCGEDGMTLLPAGVKTARDVFHWDAAAGKYASPTNETGKLMGPE